MTLHDRLPKAPAVAGARVFRRRGVQRHDHQPRHRDGDRQRRDQRQRRTDEGRSRQGHRADDAVRREDRVLRDVEGEEPADRHARHRRRRREGHDARAPPACRSWSSTWMTDPNIQPAVEAKMVGFFRNMFQQTGFIPTEDFKLQLLQNGGFDFGGSTRNVGDDAFPRLVQNLQDSFALTAWQLVKEGRPFTETLTTTRFRMTTALKSLYVQVEMPADTNQRSTSTTVLNWTIDYSGTAIPIEQALTNMVFSDEAPGAHVGDQHRHVPRHRHGRERRVQGDVGAVPAPARASRRSCAIPTNTTICNDHASKPYFTADDVSDWTWVTITPKASAADRTPVIQPYDLPALRAATTLSLSLPRYGFYTTPAFLALWNTNDSNQHRVTANQTLLVALGPGVHRRELDHAVLRRPAWTPTTPSPAPNASAATRRWIRCASSGRTSSTSTTATTSRRRAATTRATRGRRARWSTSSRSATCSATGSSMADLGGYLAQVTDGAGLPRFGISVVQQLCFYANSSPCSESDAEFRRIVGAFKDSTLQLRGRWRRSSSRRRWSPAPPRPSAAAAGEVPISIARRDHLCAALSNRLGKPDICAQAVAMPSSAQTLDRPHRGQRRGRRLQPRRASRRSRRRSRRCSIAPRPRCCARTSRPRSSTRRRAPSTPAPTFRAPSTAMVETVMGYPPSHPLHAQAAQILMDHQVGRRRGRERIGLAARQPSACGRRSRWPANRPAPWASDSRRRHVDDDANHATPRSPGIVRRQPGPAGLRHRPAGLVPAEPAARHRAGPAVRDHRAREPAVPDPQRVEQRRSAQLQRAPAPTRPRRSSTRRRPRSKQVPVTLGGQTYGAALPWADPSVMSPTDMAMGVATPATGQLKSARAGADRRSSTTAPARPSTATSRR